MLGAVLLLVADPMVLRLLGGLLAVAATLGTGWLLRRELGRLGELLTVHS